MYLPDLLSGDWEDGSRHGSGTLTLPNGVMYTGSFYAGLRHGEGALTSPAEGLSFAGEWMEDAPIGQLLASTACEL